MFAPLDLDDIDNCVPKWLQALRTAGYRLAAIANPQLRGQVKAALRLRQIELLST